MAAGSIAASRLDLGRRRGLRFRFACGLVAVALSPRLGAGIGNEMTVDEPVERSARRQRIELGRPAARFAGEDEVGRLGRLELHLAGQADELVRARTADQRRVPEPSVFAGWPAAAGQEGDGAVAAVDRGRDLARWGR